MFWHILNSNFYRLNLCNGLMSSLKRHEKRVKKRYFDLNCDLKYVKSFYRNLNYCDKMLLFNIDLLNFGV